MQRAPKHMSHHRDISEHSLTSREGRLNKNALGILAAIVVAAAIAAPVIAGDKRAKASSAKCSTMLMAFDKKSKSCRN